MKYKFMSFSSVKDALLSIALIYIMWRALLYIASMVGSRSSNTSVGGSFTTAGGSPLTSGTWVTPSFTAPRQAAANAVSTRPKYLFG